MKVGFAVFSKLAQLCSTINVFTSMLLDLYYSYPSMVLCYWLIHKLLECIVVFYFIA